jgi:hypothetical protein
MAAIGWTSIQAALAAWISSSTDVPAENVLWAFQAGPQTPRPFVSLEVLEVASPGIDWTIKDYDGTRQPGQEIRRRAHGQRVVQLRIQCFGQEGSNLDALSTLTDAIAAIPFAVDDLDAAGAGVGDIGRIQLLEGKRGSILEPRAVIQLQLHVSSEVERFETFVERVEVTINNLVTVWVPPLPAP